MKKALFIIFIALLFVFSSCKGDSVIPTIETPTPTPITEEPIDTPIPKEPVDILVVESSDTIYQLLVYSFADSNNDGVGDFKGIYEHIDYFNYLGIKSIWLSPIHPSPSYHGYDIQDYYGVREDYVVDGYTFEHLVKDLADHGISVILDMVINHASNQHQYFKDAIIAYALNVENEYINYFTFSKTSFVNPVYGYASASAYGVHYDTFLGVSQMPAWNFSYKPVRDMFLDVFRYWLDLGVSGFRMDAAKHIYDSHISNIQLLSSYKTTLEVDYPGVFFVNEIWSSDNEIINYYASQTHNLHFNFGGNAINALSGSTNLSTYMQNFQKMIRVKDENAREVPFLSNHDIGRIGVNLSVVDNKMLAALSLLSPGNSVIYYGDEIMLNGSRTLSTNHQGYDDAAYRTPMLWDAETDINAYYIVQGTNNAVKSAKTISTETVEDGIQNTQSLLNYYKKLIQIKNNYPIISTGELQRVTLGEKLITYQVIDDHQSLLVIHNLSELDINITIDTSFSLLDFVSSTITPVIVGDNITIPSKSSIILSLDQPLDLSFELPKDEVFIRGTMNSWSLHSSYMMSYDDSVHSILLNLTQIEQFKLFSNDIWYGYDNVNLPDTSYLSRESSNGNIEIQPGNYLIKFLSDEKIIIDKLE